MPYPYQNYGQNMYQNYGQNPYTTNQPYMNNSQSYTQGQSPLMNPSSGIIWVQGEVGAKAYPVGAGNSVLLMDSDDKYFYIKSADMAGMPTLHKYFYSEVIDEVPRIEQSHSYDTAQLASRDEVKQLQDEVDSLKKQLEDVKAMKEQNKRGRQNGQ